MSLLTHLAKSAVTRPSAKKSSAPAAPQSPLQRAMRDALADYAPTLGKIAALFGASAEDVIGEIVGTAPEAAHAKIVEIIQRAQEAIAADHEQGICGCQQCVAAPQGEPESIAGENGQREEYA